MYRLKDFFISVYGVRSEDIPSEEILCAESNTELTLLTNKMQDSLAAYTFTFVEQGWLTLIFNGRELTLKPGDLYVYSPGFQITIVRGSSDYKSLCLLADENMTLEMPIYRDIIRTTYLPLVEWGEPVVHVPENYRSRLSKRMREIIEYQFSTHGFLLETLRTLYTLFLLDLTDIQERAVSCHKYSDRTAELFTGFLHLLPRHYIEHHDIAFYASKLFVTTTHLSRIVRQITGRTVMDYINQMLFMEASWLLQSTDLPLDIIADKLHFADQSSFGRFFKRIKGIGPKQYRMKK
ncbi:MAG: AraC family transcriptional regulator [Bacteroidales bacterium]|jgi:AraC-like DNA-binding protein|nr:AraC family transcriptional regulator [Bacteroidales bacterium]